MTKHLIIIITLCRFSFGFSQDNRLIELESKLAQYTTVIEGLNEEIELDLENTDVHTLLTAVAKVHEMNMVITPQLKSVNIQNTFQEVKVMDLLLYLAKEYSLDYTILGNIITVKVYIEPQVIINTDRSEVNYDITRSFISLDLNNAILENVFRKITDQTGKNLLYDKNIEKTPLSIYLKEVPLKMGLEQLAYNNNLLFEESKDGFFLYSQAPKNEDGAYTSRISRQRGRSFEYTIIDTLRQQLKVNFKDVPIEDIVLNIAEDLDLGIFLASPLSQAGQATIKANSITFEELLEKVFESQKNYQAGPVSTVPNASQNSRDGNRVNSSNDPYIYKREGDLFYFGLSSQLSLRKLDIVPLKYRSIVMMQDQQIQRNNTFSVNQAFGNTLGGALIGGQIPNRQNLQNGYGPNNLNGNSNNNSNFGSRNSGIADVISDLMPDDVIENLNIKVDKELNSFIISGTADRVEKFKKLVKSIDKPVPVILIETMIIEINRSSTVETGIEWGLGDGPTTTQGNIYPSTDLRLGANTVNRILGGLEGFAAINVGRVVPNFFASLKAMETNGDISIQSSPKLSVLNGHEANLSIGQTTYYVITSRDIIGAQNPQTQIVENYQPIDAELGVFIKPIVSELGEITMGIIVNQSTFTGVRIADDAPPNISSRQFTSTVRVRDKDIIILGGLEDILKSNTGSGVPFLARIPVIKWLFSKRVREGSKSKLAILIRPTVLN
ncbi:MAG: secretin N-terminal domain-containing protein [Nonlabens sp.]